MIQNSMRELSELLKQTSISEFRYARMGIWFTHSNRISDLETIDIPLADDGETVNMILKGSEFSR